MQFVEIVNVVLIDVADQQSQYQNALLNFYHKKIMKIKVVGNQGLYVPLPKYLIITNALTQIVNV